MAIKRKTLRQYRNIEEDHEDLEERFRKTLYYGKLPGTDRPSLPLTDLAVNFFQEAAPRELGKLDCYQAATASRAACMSPTSMAVGMIYVRRLHKNRPDYLAQISSSELFLISMMIASKFLYDEGIEDEVFNDEWAVSGDLATEDINQLERDFLQAIDWKLFVKPEEFAEMVETIEKRVALQQGRDRGWFSYKDMIVLTRDFDLLYLTFLVSNITKVFSAISVAYAAGVLTMVGSTVLATASVSVLNAGLQNAALLAQQQVMPNLERSSLSSLGLHLKMDSKHMMSNTSKDSSPVYVEFPGQSNFEAEGKNLKEENQQDKKSLLNGLLPPFLALSIKNMILEYVLNDNGQAYKLDIGLVDTLREQNDQSKFEASRGVPLPTEVCSEGPCLMDSWPNCRNVTYLENPNVECKLSLSCESQNLQHLNLRLSNDYEHYREHLSFKRTGLNLIKCCCRFPCSEMSGLLPGSLQAGVLDINIGFSTQSMHAGIVTT